MILKVLQFQSCPHRSKENLCKAATISTGVETFVTAPVCNITCKTNGGPYGGRDILDSNKWDENMIKYTSHNSIHKVIQKYKNADFVLPPISNEILHETAFLKQYSWFDGIGVSGSIITKNSNPKDLDLIIFYKQGCEPDKTVIFPKEISGLKLDIFFKPKPYTGLFAVLDIESKTLYKTAFYRANSIEKGLKTVNITKWDELANSLIVTKKTTNSCGGCGRNK